MASGSDLPSREGELLAGKYRLEARLGVGGMGEVYRAHNELIGRHVAIKLLHPEHTRSADIVARFLREARAANLVRHPNVVDVLDLGQDEKGTPFIVQELLSGEDLGKYLDRAGGTLPLASVAAIMVPVIDAVAVAHAKGVVHRDLKPENIFLHKDPGADGVVPKVLDFGISKIGPQPGDIRVTTTGVSMGTPAYMSPEQVQGLSDIDARTDVWALGVMLQELVTGALPFRATAPGALFLKICTTDAEPIDVVRFGLPKDFAVVVARCLRRDRESRYPTAAELSRDLKNIAEARSVDATRRLAAVKLDDLPSAVRPSDAPADALSEVTSETLVDKRRPPSSAAAAGDARTSSPSPSPASVPASAPASETPPRVPGQTMRGVVRDAEPSTPAPARRRGLLAGAGVVALAAVAVLFVALRPAAGPPASAPPPNAPNAAPVTHAASGSPPSTALTNTDLHPAPAAPAPAAPEAPAPQANIAGSAPHPEPAAPEADAPEADAHADHNANANANANGRRHPARNSPSPARPAQNAAGGHRTSTHAATQYE